jgi:hypothetical protein
MLLWAVSWSGACNLVLGIDDVSSANGPDSGQRVSAATADPAADRDADAGSDKPGSDPGLPR